ncbi:MAG TPA: hypothetical protein VGK67_32660 [Myxococcales bacterium]|jgi:hypothetical protein
MTRLRNAIEVALMAKALNDLRAWRFLRVSHYEEVIGLPADKQRELLDRAEKESWSVVRLGQEAGKQKAARPAPAPGSVKSDKALGLLRKAMDQVAAMPGSGTALAPCLVESGVEAAAELTAALEKVLGLLEGFQKQLEQTKKRSAGKLKGVAWKVAAPA